MRGPVSHAIANDIPSRPVIPIRSIGPVMASNPVAKTMMSTGYSVSMVRMPDGVIRSMGAALTSTSVTLSRLKVSK